MVTSVKSIHTHLVNIRVQMNDIVEKEKKSGGMDNMNTNTCTPLHTTPHTINFLSDKYHRARTVYYNMETWNSMT